VTSEGLLSVRNEIDSEQTDPCYWGGDDILSREGCAKGIRRQPIGGRSERELFKEEGYSCSFAYERETICNKSPMLSEIEY